MMPLDVSLRRVRERFGREAGGDMQKLAEVGMRAFEAYKDKLGLKLVSPPKSGQRRTETRG